MFWIPDLCHVYGLGGGGLRGWGGESGGSENSANAGAFLKTWLFSEIYKSYLNAGKRPPLFLTGQQ